MKSKSLNDMTPEEASLHMTTGRLTVGTITQIVDRQFVTSWVARSRGYILSMDDNWKHKSKDAAREYGRRCIEKWKQPKETP